MAYDKVVDSVQLDSDLTSIANTIRTKGGTTASLTFPNDFISAINNISTGGGGGYTDVTSSATSLALAAPHVVLFDSSTHKVMMFGRTETGPAMMGGLDISIDFGGGTMGNDDMGYYSKDGILFYSNATLTNGVFDFSNADPTFDDMVVLLSFTATGGGTVY